MPVVDPKIQQEIADNLKLMKDMDEARAKQEHNKNLQNQYDIRSKQRQGTHEEEQDKEKQAVDELEKACDKLLEEGIRGYDTFVSAMNSMIATSLYFMKAGGSLSSAAMEMIQNNTAVGRKYLQDIGPRGLYDKASTWMHTKLDKQEVKLPDLQHNIHLDNNNKLDIDLSNVARADGRKPHPILGRALEIGATAWLDFNGYHSPNNNGKFISKIDGTALTQAQFDTLKQDPNHGLDAFLSGCFQVDVENTPHP